MHQLLGQLELGSGMSSITAVIGLVMSPCLGKPMMGDGISFTPLGLSYRSFIREDEVRYVKVGDAIDIL
jgi:hypothetical protein